MGKLRSGWLYKPPGNHINFANTLEYYGTSFDKIRYIPRVYHQFLQVSSAASLLTSISHGMVNPIYTGSIPTDNNPVIIDSGATFTSET